MKVGDLKLEPILGTNPDESLADAAERMGFYEVGALAVVENGRLVGIVTERDIVRAMADRADPLHIPVRFYMTTAPTTVNDDTDVADAVALMLSLGVRHLPVITAGRLSGMVSIRDLLSVRLEDDLVRSG